jgi:hypothetical protein
VFDFFITKTERNCINPYERIDPNEYNANTFEFRHKRIKVFGLYRNGTQKPLINDEYLFFVYGNIFKRNILKDSESILNQADLMSELIADKYNIHNYKGNFVIFLIDTKKEAISIFNSQLGIKHAYYYISGTDFYTSSNLSFLRTMTDKINISNMLQYLLFTYSLDGLTFLENIKFIRPGEILEFNEKLSVSEYYSIKQMFGKSTVKFDLNEYIRLFNKSIEQRYTICDNVFASFTGGFDGRTIISYLLKSGKNFKTYSFGKKNGENTYVPGYISDKLKINYIPIYLDEEYEASYVHNAVKVINFSDGLSFNERANYIYAFSHLAKSTNFVISGLIGGETLRPVHLKTDYMNQNYYDVFYSDNNHDYESKFTSVYSEELFRFSLNDYRNIISDFIAQKRQEIKNLKNDYGYLYYLIDLMQLGFRMYYGTEIHLERYYCENLTPYYDLDLLEYLYSTDYTDIFKNAFRNNKIFRWKGQKIYAEIIASNYPALGDFPVDRGYPPSYLLNPIKLTAVPFLYSKRKRNRNSMPDFNETKWSKYFLNDYLGKKYDSCILNDNYLKNQVTAFLNNDYEHDSVMTRLVSLQTWLNQK